MADTARVIWLFACVGYWPYRGVSRVWLLAEFGLIANIFNINSSVCHLCLRSSEHVRCRQLSIALQVTAVLYRFYGKPGLFLQYLHVKISYELSLIIVNSNCWFLLLLSMLSLRDTKNSRDFVCCIFWEFVKIMITAKINFQIVKTSCTIYD